jgi:hypothetical protein
MNRNDAVGLVIYAMQLWDAWKPSDDFIELMADIFAHDWLDAGDGRRIIIEHRRTHEYLSPNPATLTKLVAARKREILLARAAANAEAKRLEAERASGNNHRTLVEWRRWYTETEEGRREWPTLNAAQRRGLRMIWRLEETTR